MPESDMEKLLPRLRRFARCLFCESGEADDAVCESLETEIASGHGRPGNHNFVDTELRLFHNILKAGWRYKADGTARRMSLREVAASEISPHDVAAAVATLNFSERSVIALHVLEGFGLDEIAILMEISRFDVDRHLDSARQQLIRLVASMHGVRNERNIEYGICGR